jgi:hypothetical protein
MNRATVAHQMPGRARVRVAGKRGDVDYFSSAVRTLGTLDGIASVTARPETGSILIHHRLSLNAIANFARARGMFELELEGDVEGIGLQNAVSAVERALRAVASEGANAPAAIALVAIAAYQASRGHVFGPTVTHLIQALDFLRRSRR